MMHFGQNSPNANSFPGGHGSEMHIDSDNLVSSLVLEIMNQMCESREMSLTC
ncbi:hypothetical protein BJY01DRAFT_206390 [Aspergillus pseudoustus]|uniref:Uncharacterized protein n=1 Tax=Aspergillus pseudoustus TaxID=1810923 RepID=A0ABR4KND9_9EURO